MLIKNRRKNVSDSLRIIFAGTSNFSTQHLNVLIHSPHDVICVFTQPDRPAKRGKHLTFSAVKQLAKQHNLFTLQPFSLNEPVIWKTVADLKADIMVIVDYGLILPQAMLNLPRFGCINVHASLLPRWRGAAPIHRALWAGDNRTGITIIQMDSGLDTGAILHKTVCTIHPDDTSASLYKKLAYIGSNALLTTLTKITNRNIIAELQNDAFSTYAKKLSKKEARLDWHLPASQLERCVRACNPWPVSYFLLKKRAIKVWFATVSNSVLSFSKEPGTLLTVDKIGLHVVTGDGILILTSLQLAGKKITKVRDLLNAYREWFIPGMILD